MNGGFGCNASRNEGMVTNLRNGLYNRVACPRRPRQVGLRHACTKRISVLSSSPDVLPDRHGRSLLADQWPVCTSLARLPNLSMRVSEPFECRLRPPSAAAAK